MDYLFENLGDERFQEFCSCLISKEFPDFQSFPVGQPDGGRDSLVYIMNSPKKEFIVFQVKFVRNPASIPDAHKWLISILEDESAKVETLIPKGAKKFYLLTNVKGTAHLDKGSKDKVNSILESTIRIPSICWWRDDLSRIFEKDPLFKWSFPEILNGQDVLNSILFDHINSNRERRESVIRAYLAEQYAIDNEVKFRQIDLHNKLLDLFTDVPIRIKKINERNKNLKRILGYFINQHKKLVSYDDNLIFEERENIGAAAFLLHPKIQNDLDRVLIEGGPGQGKSTISQYICQVHRVRLLNKERDLRLLSDTIKNSPIRLPFKVDLRHVAQWVENKNPYQGRINEEFFEKIWNHSLESFLIGHIVYHSKIDEFNTSDLISVIKQSPVLFVFDGFDEIANLNVRKEVIEFINKGINRLIENSKSVQVVITSRPAAFSDTIGFSVDDYPHFELTDITPSITTEYVEKWIKASKLDDRESNEIKRLVAEKLKLPHLKDLAKSPMQLAIFISLLRTRGESLPNKRTALYDSYIDLFFNRESEKNPMIRDHRDLIIDIHQYLAWLLHSEAELFKNSGSIHIDELKARLKTYLRKEGHNTDIADQLFHVMEERVCALVSRVQGTYEFEVQPLREYFCAKYLYNTSPYSPVGNEKSGSKTDRFDAIARNFYWHNVVRFFSGCFDKGELPMLIHKLKELQNDEILRYTNYPRLLTSQILADWVFTQYPLLLKDVIKLILEGINIRNIINLEGRRSNNEPIVLPLECGRKELIKECFEELKKFPHYDYASELIWLVNNNSYEVIESWTENLSNLKDRKLTTWFEYAYYLEIVHKLDESLLKTIVKDNNAHEQLKRLQLLINGNRIDIIETDKDLKQLVLNGILDGNIVVPNRFYSLYSLQFLTFIIHPYILTKVLDNDNTNIPLVNFISRRYGSYQNQKGQNKLFTEFKVKDEIDEKIKEFVISISEALNKNVDEWRNYLSPWDDLVEGLRCKFNATWCIYIVAVIAAGIKSRDETYELFNDLNDDSKSLCKRVRCARMKSGNLKYWDIQFGNSSNAHLILLTFFTWATTKCIIHFYSKLSILVDNLSSEEYEKLNNALQKTSMISYFNSTQRLDIQKSLLKRNLPAKLVYILTHRLQDKYRIKFIYDYINPNEINLDNISEIRLNYLISQYLKHPDNLDLLNQIKLIYSSFKNFDEPHHQFARELRNESMQIPINIAKFIMENAREYPRKVASVAEKSCRLYANKNIRAVGEVAQEEKWFE